MSVIDLRYLRMGTAADISAANLVLALGQPGYEVDTARIKIGDGSTVWNSLGYFLGSTARTYRGAVASQAAMLALTSINVGDWVTRTDLAAQVFELTATPAATLGNWISYPAGSGGAGGIDGGTPSSSYGGTSAINGGTP